MTRKLSLLGAAAALALVSAAGAGAKEAKKIGLAVANLQTSSTRSNNPSKPTPARRASR
jgi:hypothetical protein